MSNTNPTIKDFLDHRWTEAKEALRTLDQDFVSTIENEVGLQGLGLEVPWEVKVDLEPRKRLPSSYHRLLEACLELEMQAGWLKSSASHLRASAHAGRAVEDVGRDSGYHLRSWFAHVNTLGERAESVIEWTIRVHPPAKSQRTQVNRNFKGQVYDEVIKHVQKQRDQYSHGTTRSWVSGLTEEGLWEGMVASGMLPSQFLTKIRYPERGSALLRGKYEGFVGATEEIFTRLGTILRRLEVDLGLT